MTHTRVEISRSALLHNIAQFRSLLTPQTKCIVAVKANAYGHGLAEVGSVVQDAVDYCAVINMYEARKLREAQVHTPILILGYTSEREEDIIYATQERIELVINSLSHAERISQLVPDGSELKVHIKIDTGMARMGILPKHAVDYIQKIGEMDGLFVKGVVSHFADVVGHKEYTHKQFDTFTDIRTQLAKENVAPQLFHIAKTEAILDFPESQMDAVRLGIGLYGLWPDPKLISKIHKKHPGFELKPVLSWKTSILQVKEYPTGSFVGYGCTYQTKRKTHIAVIPVGYYEGFDRGLSNVGKVLIGGVRCPIVGRVCMNMSMVDVTDVPDAQRGDEVVLIGEQGDEIILAREMAEWLDTIAYEVVTRINAVIPRVVIE